MLEYLFYTLFFLVPLIFYPKTSEVFEFNKMVFVYIMTLLVMAFWIIKMIKEKKIIFKRTILDIPLILFLGSQIISTLISIDAHTSIFGYYSRFNGGLLSTICYALLYWAYVSNMTKKFTMTSVYCLLSSAFVVAIYGIFEHFGGSISCVIVAGKFNDDCWVQDVKTRVFATLGQPNWLSAYLVALMPLAISNAIFNLKFIISNQFKNFKFQISNLIWLLITILFFMCILFTGSRSGLLGLAVALVILAIFNLKKYFKEFAIIGFVFLIIALIFGTPFTPPLRQAFAGQASKPVSVDTGEGGTESGAIRAIVWKGAIDIWKAYPVFGTGVETFGYSYWQFRPVEHNNTSEWDYLYNKAHNEYLNTLANSGIIGLGTYLILVLFSILQILNLQFTIFNQFSIKKFLNFKHLFQISNFKFQIALLAGYISILITNFFGFSVVVISLFTFLFPAMAVAIATNPKSQIPNSKDSEKLSNSQLVLIGIVVIGACYLLFTIYRYWLADYFYASAKSESAQGVYTNTFKDLHDSISYSPGEAIYYNEMTRVFTNVALGLNENNEATKAAQIVPYAISASDTAFDLSPRNMNIRETRISTYLELAQFDTSYLQLAINLINDTIPLSPTDPKLPLLLGKTYANSGKIDLAIIEFKKALALKPDYEEAKKDLAVVEKIQKK